MGPGARRTRSAAPCWVARGPEPRAGACWTQGSGSSRPPALCGFACVPHAAFPHSACVVGGHFPGSPRGFKLQRREPGGGVLVGVTQGPWATRALSTCVLARRDGRADEVSRPPGAGLLCLRGAQCHGQRQKRASASKCPILQPEGLVPSPRSGAALLSGTPEGGASHPRPRPRPRPRR